MTEQTIESKVASAILERPVASIELDGVKYDIAPPSIATLILVSEIVSTLPEMKPVSGDKICIRYCTAQRITVRSETS